MNSMFNMLFFLLFHAIHSAEPAAGTRARASGRLTVDSRDQTERAATATDAAL
ncbi:hypothetical protein BURMUCF2_1064 [Burkholderia multivorans CF2]|nr:hypothetical protein BURMUCF2_1064 [Burkholderia multivorans CF2]